MNTDHKHRRRRQPWPDSPVMALAMLSDLRRSPSSLAWVNAHRDSDWHQIRVRIRNIRRRSHAAARMASC